MIVTKSWLQEWINLDGVSTEELAKTFNAIGLEVDRIEAYRVPKKIVFGHVLECEKHPDADKLNVCKVDIGTSVRQIVCGAANVRAGLDVVVATVGATMPNGMAIKPVKLRGVESEGMICSAGEIGLPDLGKGILELDGSIGAYELGAEVATNAVLNDDLIEIELTANRGDCLSIRGVARDLSAALDRPLKEYTLKENDEKRGIGRIFALSHEKLLDVSLNYKALELESLELPLLVTLRLAQIEEKLDNAIEALLLYTTHATGVILRAYDYDFFPQDDQGVAKATLKEDENGYACIYGKEKASTVGITQYDLSRATTESKTILVEASYIPPDLISKKMAEKNQESCAMFYKTSRGSEPELCLGIEKGIELFEMYAQAKTFGGSITLSNPYKDKIVMVTKQEIDTIIGAEIDKGKISKILKNLGFDISKSSTEKFVISVPQFRHDIVNKQDIIEEIVRMVGIDNIPAKPFVLQEDNRLDDDYFTYKKRSIYRHKAAANGFFESVHFVFDEKKVLKSYGFETTKDELELVNPIVQTLDTLRPTLLTGLLKAASNNIKNGYASVRLFEVGSVFTPAREESINMAFLFGGESQNESLGNTGKPSMIDFASFVQKISNVIGDIELRKHETTHSLSHIYQSASVLIDGTVVGELFRVHPEVEKSYDLPVTYVCELDFAALPYELKTAQKTSKYQASFRDLSLLVPQNMSYATIKSVIEADAPQELVRFYPVDRYVDETLGDKVSLSLRFVLQSDEKTLEEEDITSAMERLLQALESELGVGLR